jgi:hypothetical protein
MFRAFKSVSITALTLDYNHLAGMDRVCMVAFLWFGYLMQ